MAINENELTRLQQKLSFYKTHWQLSDDGELITTHSGILQFVVYKGAKAMLKITLAGEECRGSLLMVCWNGQGAAKVLLHDNHALLMERATGNRSLRQMVLSGDEDGANEIICDVTARLHQSECRLGELTGLKQWFSALEPAAHKYGGILLPCSDVANELLNSMTDIVVLHGDIHYDNILDSGSGGWVAVDPKGLIGERCFDFANIFCNPTPEIAASPSRLKKQVKFIGEKAGLPPQRLLCWIVAWAGLSAAWELNDGEDAMLQLMVAEIAFNELRGQ